MHSTQEETIHTRIVVVFDDDDDDEFCSVCHRAPVGGTNTDV